VADDLVLLLVGFLLTSVLGGGLGYLFQRRSWTHQHETVRAEQERQQAIKVFEEVSSLLDKRLYRMRRLYWATKRAAQGEVQSDVPAARSAYEEVLQVWNDNLNRNLALVATYFGRVARLRLETELYERFAAIGRELEGFVRSVYAPGAGVVVPPLGRRLSALGHQVYEFNLYMLDRLRTGDLGGEAAEKPSAAERDGADTPLLQKGDTGAAVRRTQESLRRAGVFDGQVDGHFGRQTEQAVRAFQSEHGLHADGIVGRGTWAALP
jgi:hypothetical protein